MSNATEANSQNSVVSIDSANVSITAINANAVEDGMSGIFRIQRTNTIGNLTVNLTIDDNSLATVDDYTLAIDNNPVIVNNNTFNITIADGESFVDLNLNAIAEFDSFAEGDEPLKLNLSPDTEYQIDNTNNTATVTINANGFLVNNTEDSTSEYQQGSLRQAILNANNIAGENTIIFDTDGLFATAQTITLDGDELSISDSISIQGTDANKLTLSGDNASRVFSLIGEGITATFAGLTITNGTGEDLGGGIFVGEDNILNLINSSVTNNTAFIGGGIGNSGILNIINSTFSGNTAFFGSAIDNTGTLKVINSTISGNTAEFAGGGIYNNSGTATLINVTVANNFANNLGAGIFNAENSTFNLANTIVANNNGTNTDLDGNFTDFGNNLIGKSEGNNGFDKSIVGTSEKPIDPKLAPLANNGGTTLTHALFIDSPAINQGNNTVVPAGINTDQLNSQRIIGNNVDIGAVEFVGYTISGKFFDDSNNNGAFDFNENGLPNWEIYLDENNNNILDSSELFTTTDGDGNYSFFVTPGIYNLRKIQQTGWQQTNPNYNPINIANTDVKNINFGNFKLGEISGKIFNDANQNTIFDEAETGIKNWQVFLDTNDNGLLDENEKFTTTDENGDYIFTGLIAGSYKVRKVPLNEWQQTTNNPENINIISGSNITDVNFGSFNNDSFPNPTSPIDPTNPTPQVILEIDCFCDRITTPDVNNLPNVSVEINSTDSIQFGDEENNLLIATNNNNALFGFNGEDTLLGGIGADNLIGGTGNDLIFGGDGRDWIGGNEGEDIINGNEGNDLINGNQGNDTVYGGQGNDFVRGGQDNDLLLGDIGNDTLAGDRGNDSIFGGGSNASGNSDNDLMFGGSGDDLLHGNTGNDTIFGEEGNDTVHAGQDDDIVCGGVGEDLLYGDFGNDSLCGDDDNDTIFGGNGGETSASDDDYICGGDGNDLVFGNQGADWINGETGNDTLYGGQGNDTLIGGDGNDLLTGDLGNDILIGGNGSDRFLLAVGQGSDVITDFQDGVDFLVLSDDLTFQQLSIVQSESNTLIRLTSNNELLATLNGISANLITEQDFVLLA
ncbi:hypothetical protein NIES2119_31590 [[Phormidium ambiguum] IAM M-71]|uniref:SD-repeat containing protein B domain-containing protein n=1 Tax=[Phormidium ambiguum] IAM M-71 TaxID=454136 RepID=A0A1U7I239_9CYAN|nr:choice-of-anchor Q domain-containing protein [Phormidium ambiguum]OKH30089.1 hypothetical protein NIES2119_31590 [Phormidium ambiguum IAM M-71]